ncbi:MAG: alpha-amylase family glycosyl hydrolase [Bradymonadia bacterium]
MPSARLSPQRLQLDAAIEPTAYAPLGVLISADAWRTHHIDALIADAPEGRRQGALLALGSTLGDAALMSTAALLSEVLRFVVVRHLRLDRPGALTRALGDVEGRLGERTQVILEAFAEAFPPAAVRQGDSAARWLHRPSETGEDPRHDLLEELVLLAVQLDNHALNPIGMLFDDRGLNAAVGHRQLTAALISALDGEGPVGGAEGMSLWATLTAPHKASPDDLAGQLTYILGHWQLPETLQSALLRAQDVLQEAHRFRGHGPGPVQGPGVVYAADEEIERFSEDGDWMSQVVLIAKQTYVWLDQLSRQYRRAITRLDQIPDEALDALAEAGFTGLWLIGVWTRSEASQTIKRRSGNPEARASAYSLYDYSVAEALGGEGAVDHLRARCTARGIRLAADMVPNHFGLHSRWMLEQPDRFLSLDAPPYPNYTFDGPDLCPDPGVGLYLEDGYWDRRDAAVVFKRVDHGTGEARYIYHGNDGTQMPWNDTAQIDYLNPEAREAVIQCILHVARRFPIIRFDAAMTLARRHVQRLWFPPPGEGGAIPSRAARGLTQADFDAAMPEEFWRQVVDRVAVEAPDTLLLAEAFWLMEGYFVRTLGMHRVYNSAFMHMLKDEDNAGYRSSIKEVLAFSPQILKRFVNFMSNPDEETAIEQFGKGDKYFGICQLMLTLPGLPMIAHGQIEGFAEKYGMEYGRAYWDETPDEGLVSWHGVRVFPLMRRRALFSEATHFALYDFHGESGVDEHVYAFTNRAGDERALVLYHNRFGHTGGRITESAPINVAGGGETHLVTRTLIEALDLDPSDEALYVFREQNSELEYLRTGGELAREGFFAALGPYEAQIFLDWRRVDAPDEHWWSLWASLEGAGVANAFEARWLQTLAATHEAVSTCFTRDALQPLVAGSDPTAWSSAYTNALAEAPGETPTAEELVSRLDLTLDLSGVSSPALARAVRLAQVLHATRRRDDAGTLWSWWRLQHVLEVAFTEPASTEDDKTAQPHQVDSDIEATDWVALTLTLATRLGPPAMGLHHLLAHERGLSWLRVNTHEGVRWFNGERMEMLLEGVSLLSGICARPEGDVTHDQLVAAVQASAYRLDDLLSALSPEAP